MLFGLDLHILKLTHYLLPSVVESPHFVWNLLGYAPGLHIDFLEPQDVDPEYDFPQSEEHPHHNQSVPDQRQLWAAAPSKGLHFEDVEDEVVVDDPQNVCGELHPHLFVGSPIFLLGLQPLLLGPLDLLMLQHFIGPVEEESEDKDDEEEGLLGGPGQVADEVDLFEEVYGRQVEDEGEEEEGGEVDEVGVEELENSVPDELGLEGIFVEVGHELVFAILEKVWVRGGYLCCRTPWAYPIKL